MHDLQCIKVIYLNIFRGLLCITGRVCLDISGTCHHLELKRYVWCNLYVYYVTHCGDKLCPAINYVVVRALSFHVWCSQSCSTLSCLLSQAIEKVNLIFWSLSKIYSGIDWLANSRSYNCEWFVHHYYPTVIVDAKEHWRPEPNLVLVQGDHDLSAQIIKTMIMYKFHWLKVLHKKKHAGGKTFS